MPASEPAATIAMPRLVRVTAGTSHGSAPIATEPYFATQAFHHDDFTLGQELDTDFARNRFLLHAVVAREHDEVLDAALASDSAHSPTALSAR